MLTFFSNAFQGFSTLDVVAAVIDVVVVYYLIYRVLLLIKGTRAVQVLAGLVLVMVLYFVSQQDYLGFATLNWLLEKFIASFVVILVILFQDDIRRGLSEMGKTSHLAGLSQLEQTHFLEEIVKACASLGERRIGALIAIEREASLSAYAAESLRIDAAVTRELLVSLFIPFRANPTHDGAVIIRGGRIAAAGCFLPLTASTKLDKSLGTRHRAAIGLSEVTDAVVIVVSEETGIISVAFRDELTRRLSTEELRDLLQKLFNKEALDDPGLGSGSILKRLRLPRRGRRAVAAPENQA